MAILGRCRLKIIFFAFSMLNFLFYLGILDAAVLRVAAAMAKASLIDLLIAQALSSSSSSSSAGVADSFLLLNLILLLLFVCIGIWVYCCC
jgi:hypothetical protein